MQNFQSISRLCTTKLVAKYLKHNMPATCANVVHVPGKCGKPDKNSPGVWVNGYGKCGISEASAECIHPKYICLRHVQMQHMSQGCAENLKEKQP